MEEKIFFEYEDVKITNIRFLNGGQTYAMNNVTSVKSFEQNPNRVWVIIILIIGLLVTINKPVIGVTIIAICGIFMYKQKTFYHVMLATAGGEVSALKTDQRQYLEKVVAALNEAIVYRG